MTEASAPPSSEAEPNPYAAPIAERPAIEPGGFYRAFSLTWLSYATYYLGRKSLGVARSSLEATFGEAMLNFTVVLDTAYLAAYALGQGPNGLLGDRYGARRLIGFGMLISALACAAFGLSALWPLFFVAMVVNGFAQSSGWPGNIKAMGEWTAPEKRGRIMGIWSTCYQVGGIVATGFATWLLANYGWRAAFIAPGACVAIVGLLVFAFLKPGPLAPKTAHVEDRGAGVDEAVLREAQVAARKRLLKSPAVWSYGTSYFCIKLIRYSLLFWLPYYFEKVLFYSKADAGYFSTSFEIGGVFGAVGLGMLSDRARHLPRSLFAAVSLLGLAAALFLYVQIGASSHIANFLGMALIGALLFGPDALLSGAAAQDAGGPYAAALAAGMVNGLGSLGGVLQGAVTRGVSKAYGWTALFYVFLAFAILAALSLLPTLVGKGRTRAATS